MSSAPNKSKKDKRKRVLDLDVPKQKEEVEVKEKKRASNFADEVKKLIPAAREAAVSNLNNLPDSLGKLLALEKKTRLGLDFDSTWTLCEAILQLLLELKQWKQLNEHVTLLCKRRAQSVEKVVRNIVKEAVTYVDKTPDKDTKVELIETLRTVSAGKIVVELERARLTKQLAELKEKDGETGKAAEILQEVQVETIGSMDVREKAEFLLEQIRLCLHEKDYVRVEIISNKVVRKTLDGEGFEDLKLKFYGMMIEFHKQKGNYFEICKGLLETFRTKKISTDSKQAYDVLQKAILYCILAPFDSEVSDLLNRLKQEKKLNHLPKPRQLLDAFTQDELIKWPLSAEGEWKNVDVFRGEKGAERWEHLHKRVIQHNLRIISQFYERISTARLSFLLQLPDEKAEEHLSEMVSSGQMFAKIDRPAGQVSFVKKQTPAEQLNAWSHDITEMLYLVEKTCHLINKENMVHGVNVA